MKPQFYLTAPILFALSVYTALAGVSTNKSFMLETNNVLPPNETNFFAVNSNLLNAAVGGGGGGAGVSSVNGLTGAVTGVVTNGESSSVALSNSLSIFMPAAPNADWLAFYNNGVKSASIDSNLCFRTSAGAANAVAFGQFGNFTNGLFFPSSNQVEVVNNGVLGLLASNQQIFANTLNLNSNISGPGWSIVTNGAATATFATYGPNGGYGLFGSAGWTNYALYPSIISLTANGLTGNITASGSITAASFSGNLNASQLANGTVPYSALPFGTNSVLAYGADPTGVSDSTSAFANCANLNTVTYIPPGRYLVQANSINLTNTNAVIYGDGNSSMIQMSTFPANGVLINATNGTRLRDFQIVGSNAIAYATGSSVPVTYGLQWNCDLNGSVQGVTISGFAIGLNVIGTNSIQTRPQMGSISGCIISNCYNGLYLESTNQAEYLEIYGNRLNHCYRGLLNQSAANDIITGNKMIDCIWALYHNPVASSVSDGGTLDGYRGHSIYEGNVFNHSTYGVALIGTEGVNFTGNTLQGNGQLNMTNCTNCVVLGNQFETVPAWVNLSGGSSNLFKHNWLIGGGNTNISGATTGANGNSFWEGNLQLGAGGVALMGQLYDGFDFNGDLYGSGNANVTSNVNVGQGVVITNASGTNTLTPTNRNLTLNVASVASAPLLASYNTTILNPSNVLQKVYCDFNTSANTANTIYITNTWYWPANAGTNQCTTFTGYIEGNSQSGAVTYWTTTPISFVYTNGVAGQGHLAGTTGAFAGNSVPATVVFTSVAAGWSYGLTPGSATSTHVVIWGELHHRY